MELSSTGDSVKFRNKSYSLTAARHGGGILNLNNASGKSVLRHFVIESLGGYRMRVSADGNFFDAKLIFSDGKNLHYRVYSHLRNSGRSAFLTGISTLADYTFRESDFLGQFLLNRNGGMPGKGGRIVLASAEYDPLVLMESGKPFPAYLWKGLNIRFQPNPSEGVSVFASSAPAEILPSPIYPKIPAVETFDDFTVPGVLLSGNGNLRKVLPWTTLPPPRLSSWLALFGPENEKADNSVLHLRRTGAVRVPLTVSENAEILSFRMKNENTLPVKMDVQIFLTRKGKTEKSKFEFSVLPGGKWQEFSFPVKQNEPGKIETAVARFGVQDAEKPVMLDQVTFLPEKK